MDHDIRQKLKIEQYFFVNDGKKESVFVEKEPKQKGIKAFFSNLFSKKEQTIISLREKEEYSSLGCSFNSKKIEPKELPKVSVVSNEYSREM